MRGAACFREAFRPADPRPLDTGVMRRHTTGMHWSWQNIDWDKTLAVLVATAAIVQAVVGVIMMRGLKHAAEQASAANKALKIAQTASEQQLRAYLDVHRIKAEARTPGEPWRLRCSIKNFGQTPAMKVRHTGVIGLFAPELLGSEPVPEHDDDANSPLGPGDQLQVDGRIGADTWEPRAEQIASGELVCAALGRVTYEDIFGKTRETYYRMYLDPEVETDIMGAWKSGNTMD